ncbi:hypothetical protein TDB9533_01673 [Thalassocella blandensis]|nr:hypothetical protein TDB9533_01673 [Thalassocella blandensis]
MNIRKLIFIKSLVFILTSLFLAKNLYAEALLNGVTTHSELGTEQFVAGLFASTLSKNASSILTANEEKAIEVRVLADRLSTRRFKRMWIEGMAINASPQELEKQANNMAAFSNMLRVKLKRGDIFAVRRSVDDVSVLVNGTQIGLIEDPAFFDLLLRTWIGPVPLSSDFRDELLSEGVIKSGPLALFEQTAPTAERRDAIAAAIGPVTSTTSESTKAAAAAAATTVAAVKPKIDVPAPGLPKADQTKIALAPPKVDTPTATPTPEATPKATPTPQKVAIAPKQEILDESIFDEEEDIEFTAESLLKEQLYYTQLAKYTHKFLQYPQRAWDRGREGNIRLRVTIDRDGKVINTELLEEARYRSLNREAQDAVKRASPYPPMPEEVSGKDYSFTFRVAFKIVNR